MKYDKTYTFVLSIGYPNATIECEVEPYDVVRDEKEWNTLTPDGQYARLHQMAYGELEDCINVYCSDCEEPDDDDEDKE